MLTIRNIDESLKAKLKVIAAQHGVSMEEQVRRILRESIQSKSKKKGLGSRINQRFLKVGGIDLELPSRSTSRQAPDYTDL